MIRMRTTPVSQAMSEWRLEAWRRGAHSVPITRSFERVACVGPRREVNELAVEENDEPQSEIVTRTILLSLLMMSVFCLHGNALANPTMPMPN